MTSPKAVLKSVAPKLVPYFKTVAIYFVLFIPSSNPSWFAVLIKCLPIISLIIFVLLHGMSLGDEYSYSRRILVGLILSCVGDAFLVYPGYFLHGVTAFGAAHLSYTYAFGFKPLQGPVGFVCVAFGLAMYAALLPGLAGRGAFVPMVAVYQLLITIMVWRAIARVQFFEDLWTWTKLCSCIGGILFVISDGVIGIDLFLSPVPYSQAIIMLTYYAAQLGISLSVVDRVEDYTCSQVLLSTNSETSPKPPHTKFLESDGFGDMKYPEVNSLPSKDETHCYQRHTDQSNTSHTVPNQHSLSQEKKEMPKKPPTRDQPKTKWTEESKESGKELLSLKSPCIRRAGFLVDHASAG